MAVSTTSGARFFIGPITPLRSIDFSTDAAALTDFTALTGWLEVTEVDNFGEHGDSANEVTFTSVGDRRVRKLKGARNAGSMTVSCGRDPLDLGQKAMIAAEKTDFEYAFRIDYADAEDEDHTDSTEYFIGLVMSRPTNMGGNDQVTMRTFNIGINSDILEVISAVIP